MTDSQTDNGYLPISSQKAQTGGADLVAEYIQLQSCNILCLFTPLRNFAGLFLIDDPPFLSVIVIPCLLQGQGDVQFLSIYKNENKLCHSLRLRLIKMQMSKFCSFWKKKKKSENVQKTKYYESTLKSFGLQPGGCMPLPTTQVSVDIHVSTIIKR